MGQRDKK